MNLVTESRWHRVTQTLGINASQAEYQKLKTAYSEPHRAYHTLQHLNECLSKLDWLGSYLASDTELAIIETALWYHDAVYKPLKTNNELRSAEWAVDYLSSQTLASDKCQAVYDIIMATCHGDRPNNPMQQLAVDIDLSILGAETLRFQEYETQVREEYRHVPRMIYRRKRKKLLEDFLANKQLYMTRKFVETHEEAARKNLRWAIKQLA